MSPQCTRLLSYLRKNKSITRADAFYKLGITNLWARCAELRDAGKRISSYRVTVRGKFGETSFCRYYLAGR